MDALFQALAHPHRRQILDILKSEPGSTVTEVCAYFDTSRIAVMKHLRVLEDAQLLISEKVGRERRMYHNSVPIQMMYDRWTSEYSALWSSRLAQIKYQVEAEGSGGSPSKPAGKRKLKRKTKRTIKRKTKRAQQRGAKPT